MSAGYVEGAVSWRDWVLRAVAGDPEDLQIMYGLGGERRLDEYELAGCPATSLASSGSARRSGQRSWTCMARCSTPSFALRQLGIRRTGRVERDPAITSGWRRTAG